MLFGLFYSPASIIIIIFYANPLFYAKSPSLLPLPPTQFPTSSALSFLFRLTFQSNP